jgi:tetratricopeptide (TPR) repeat protein
MRMNALNLRIALLLGVAGLLISGCHGTSEPAPRVGGSGKISAEDMKFETSEDPPLKANTHFAAGQLAETQGDLGKAVDQYWKAVKVQPKCKEALYRLGVLYCRLEHFPDAVVAWKEYVKATDGAAIGYSNLAFCHELAGQHAEAEAAYRKGIEKDPNNNPCRVNYGLMLARDGRITEATIQLQTVLTSAEVHYNLASVFEFQGKKDQAKSEYRQALRIDPDFADAEVRLSVLR